MEQVRIAVIQLIMAIMPMLITIHTMTMMSASVAMLMLMTNTQLLECKNLEIERLVNENAQLRRDLQRLRGNAGEE